MSTLAMSSTDTWSYSTPALTNLEFVRFQALIHAETGIYLSEAKRPLIVGRLAKRLRILQLSSFTDYYRLVESDEPEKVQMIDCICTNETHFFRERRQFDFLESRVIPEWKRAAEAGRRAKDISVWSAACSTGEEPYSIAMFLLHNLGEDWTIRIEATDLSSKVLERAMQGVWPIQKSGEIPQHLLKAYMLKGVGEKEGWMKASSELRSRIHFQRMNLNGPAYPVTGPFDLIFCCNVLIYFNSDTKRQIISRLIDKLTPNGYLMLGHAESLNGLNRELIPAAPTVYMRPGLHPQASARQNG